MINGRIYMDHAATTYVKDEVLQEMLPVYGKFFGNPSSIYAEGREAKKLLEQARERVAKALGAEPREIYFTGCGTESDNWAIKGTAFANAKKGKHLITSAIEHHAVLHTMDWLKKQGFEITYLPVDEYGLVNPEDLKNAIREDTTLVSIMYANNEIGTIEPIKELGDIAHERGVLFHTDAVQAVGSVPINLSELPVDMLSLSGHKLYAPKGTGVLYIKRGTKIENFMHGGGQERTFRAGTEALPNIVGLGKAIELASETMDENMARLTAMRDRLRDGLLSSIPYSRLNGHPDKRLPGNLNMSFSYVEGESLLLLLDMKGVSASSGSACTSGSLDPSHVLLAIGLPHETAHGSLRLSLGACTTDEDIDFILRELPPIVERLRSMSPLYNQKTSADKN